VYLSFDGRPRTVVRAIDDLPARAERAQSVSGRRRLLALGLVPLALGIAALYALILTLSLVMAVYLPAALLRSVLRGSVGDGFAWRENLAFIKANLANYALALVSYLLAGFAKRDALSTEGAIKYFLLGSFSSAILLFGLALVWGLTGTTSVAGVAASLRESVATGSLSAGLAMGLAFLTTGVAFKIAAVPFHYWTPDAYQGSPTPVTGYLSVGPKVGAFALIIRLFVEALGPLSDQWVSVMIVLAAITMTLGNLVALTQGNVKRMLAYSSIAHTGYMLVGLAAYASGQIQGLEGLLYYGAAYTFMNLGAFAVVSALQKRQGVTSSLDTFAGLGRREPFLGILMTLFLLSLTGIPPTAGFFAKALVILSAVQAGGAMTWLAVIAVLNAAAAAFYYLRVVVYMYMRDPVTGAATASHGALMRAGLVVAMIGTIALGVFPNWPVPVLDAAQAAAQAVGTVVGTALP